MTTRSPLTLSPTLPAEIEKEGDEWTLVLVRELRHPPARVWQALTDPEHLREWAPFDSDRSLAAAGTTAKLTTIGAPQLHVTETTVKRADPPKALEYTWGGKDMRWELEPQGAGTKLTLWAQITKNYISMGAAGWHVCFDVLERFLSGDPSGRTAGPAAMQVDGWQQLLAEYSKKLGVEAPRW